MVEMSERIVLIIQLACVLCFIGLLSWNLVIYQDVSALKHAISQLEVSAHNIRRIEQRLTKFKRVEEQIISCSGNRNSYGWQDVILDFGSIDFPELLTRLSMMNSIVADKYKSKGVFVLTGFQALWPLDPDRDDVDPDFLSIVPGPFFKVEGRLLCLCQ